MGISAALLTGEGVRRNVIAQKDTAEEQRKALARQAKDLNTLRKSDLEALALLNSEATRRPRGQPRQTVLTGPTGTIGNPGGGKQLLGL